MRLAFYLLFIGFVPFSIRHQTYCIIVNYVNILSRWETFICLTNLIQIFSAITGVAVRFSGAFLHGLHFRLIHLFYI